jgi:hypothetical protein
MTTDDLLYTPICREFSFEMLFSQNLNSVKTLSWLNDIIGLSQAVLENLKAIDLALSCFKISFQGKTIKWFTDNQNWVQIVNAGSMKEKLHSLALSIFSTCVEKGISIDIPEYQWPQCRRFPFRNN